MKLLNRVAINTRTEKELKELLEFYEKNKITWASGRKATEFNPYLIHKENTCIVLHYNVITYECVDCHRAIEREVVLYSDIKGEI